jgi:putative PIN family toxin of toxin-antitoxin system
MADPLRVVFDTTILVSAFLTARTRGVAAELLQRCSEGVFTLYVSDAILNETEDVLLNRAHLRRRFQYTDVAVRDYCRTAGTLATVLRNVPITPVVRDPNDDMIIACAIAAEADYLVTRDKDLLELRSHRHVTVLAPEALIALLRSMS